MRISLNWLKEYVDIPVDAMTLAEHLTMLGLEIEAIERPGAEISEVYIGQILSIEPHPDADKLVVCRTDIGREDPLQIICGATNMKVGDKAPTAIVGATLPGGFAITRRKMRGIESFGMMCSPKELGLGEDHQGLMIFDPETPVGADAKTALGLDDVILEIEVTPNRGDWDCMIGVARELAAFYNTPCRIPELRLDETGEAATALSSVTIEDPEKCPRYIGRVLDGVRVGPSPDWLCRRLIAAGQRPINNIVDITNYVLLETGHPLHAFDYDKLAENRIVVRCARPGESMTTLDGTVRKLTPDMLVIADAKAPQAVAGVMGGADSEVGEGASRIFLESAYFNPVSIRRTSRALGLLTEASQHFQRGADPEMAFFAINRAAMLIQELAGARIAHGLLDAHPKPYVAPTIPLRHSRSNALLGTDIDGDTQRNMLQRLGFGINNITDDSCDCTAPTWRPDVTQEADLIEEIARLHGYDKIPVTLPQVRQSEMVFAPHESKLRKLRRLLVDIGLTELVNWTFSSKENVQRAKLSAEYLDMVALQNPLSENHATMRSSLIPGLLANAAFNLNHGVDRMAAFELGPVYKSFGNNDLPDERVCMGVILIGPREEPHWSKSPQPYDFYDLKGFAEAILDFFDEALNLYEKDLDTFQPRHSAVIQVNESPVGVLGKVAASVLKAFDIEKPVYLLELDLQRLLEKSKIHHQFEAIPVFPPCLRDMAVLVDRDVPVGKILAEATQAGGNLLKKIDVFDVYTGEPIPAGKKNVALSLAFQSPEKTLTDADTQKSWDRILKRLEKEFNAVLR